MVGAGSHAYAVLPLLSNHWTSRGGVRASNGTRTSTHMGTPRARRVQGADAHAQHTTMHADTRRAGMQMRIHDGLCKRAKEVPSTASAWAPSMPSVLSMAASNALANPPKFFMSAAPCKRHKPPDARQTSTLTLPSQLKHSDCNEIEVTRRPHVGGRRDGHRAVPVRFVVTPRFYC